MKEIHFSDETWDILTRVIDCSNSSIQIIKLNEMDGPSKEHSMRVSMLATQFGAYNDIPHKDRIILGYSGLFHDLGKTDKSISYLLSKTDLSSEELKQVKAHMDYGRELIREFYISDVMKVTMRVHESKNNPYPRKAQDTNPTNTQTKRENDPRIVELGQILALADMYDRIVKPSYNGNKPPNSIGELEAAIKSDFTGDPRYITNILKHLNPLHLQ
ncbi:MAG: HD domain-containing protein [Nanoarchaeota archaeon]|nr:HD domain-containing protein [Nanoarchaeota archaeon]